MGAALPMIPHQWTRPVVESVLLPAHAQTSPRASGCLEGSSSPGLPIADASGCFNSTPFTPGTPTVDAIAISACGTPCRIAGVTLNLAIHHTYRGDLDVTLTSPQGTDFVIRSHDDNSAHDIIRNNQFITAFNNENPEGDWVLTVQDFCADDTGTLISWSLSVSCHPA